MSVCVCVCPSCGGLLLTDRWQLVFPVCTCVLSTYTVFHHNETRHTDILAHCRVCVCVSSIFPPGRAVSSAAWRFVSKTQFPCSHSRGVCFNLALRETDAHPCLLSVQQTHAEFWLVDFGFVHSYIDTLYKTTMIHRTLLLNASLMHHIMKSYFICQLTTNYKRKSCSCGTNISRKDASGHESVVCCIICWQIGILFAVDSGDTVGKKKNRNKISNRGLNYLNRLEQSRSLCCVF